MAELMEGRWAFTNETVRLEIVDARVAAVQRPAADDGDVPWLLPGLCDMQLNGFEGYDLNAEDVSAATVDSVTRAVWSSGVAGFLPTLITGSQKRLVRAARAIAEACEADPLVAATVLGVHLEGPSVSPEDGPRGAHPRQHVRAPDVEAFEEIHEASGRRIAVTTLCPAWRNAEAFIEHVRSLGVHVSIGHTSATPEQIRRAVDAGATLATHLGNGCSTWIHRHDAPFFSLLAERGVTPMLIADGHHLPTQVLLTAWRASRPAGAIVTSDAIHLAGLAPGRYGFGGSEVDLSSDGRVSLVGTPYMAGSASPLWRALRHLVRGLGLPLEEAARAMTDTPLSALGRHEEAGRPVVGAPATFTVLSSSSDDAFAPVHTVINGRTVWSRAGKGGDAEPLKS